MALLSVPDRQTVRSHLADIRHQVKLLFFTQTIGGPESAIIARQVLDEVVSLNDRISLEEVNFILDKDPLFARLTLSGDELALYRKIFDALRPQSPVPDLVIYLQAQPDTLIERVRRRGVDFERSRNAG